MEYKISNYILKKTQRLKASENDYFDIMITHEPMPNISRSVVIPEPIFQQLIEMYMKEKK